LIKASDVIKGEDGKPTRYLTLGNDNDKSDERFHVSISGINANLIDWEKVSRVKIELFCKSYLNDEGWCKTFGSYTVGCELKEVEVTCLD
jgi:hypothetical protein